MFGRGFVLGGGMSSQKSLHRGSSPVKEESIRELSFWKSVSLGSVHREVPVAELSDTNFLVKLS